MITEAELRDALEHSATRADALSVAMAPLPPTRRRATRLVLPAVSAAAVLAVVVGVAQLRGDHPSAAPPAPAAATPTPTVTTATGARIAVDDLVNVGVADANYEIHATDEPGGRAEYVAATVGGRDIRLIAMPPAAGFDPTTRFTAAQRVEIDGTLGWYGQVVLWPADGVPDQNTDKHGGTSYALGWQAPDGTWLFVTAGYHEDVGAGVLRDAYAALDVTVTSGATRVPYRTGWLPDGLRVVGAGTAGANPVSDVQLADGGRSLDINIGRGQVTEADSSPPIALPTFIGSELALPAEKQVGPYVVAVYSADYDEATLQRVLDGLTFADLDSGSAGWFTLADAFGS